MKHHAYVIKWRDSCSNGGWRRVDTLDREEIAIITSVGWIVRQTKKEITITTSMSDRGNVMDTLTIPREAVTMMTRLKQHIVGK